MSEGFNLPETRRFIRTNKEKETKEHERQDFWSFAACGKILCHLCHQLKKPIILEVEMPEEEMAIRRINFYKRQGFTLWEKPYMQPPYKSGDDYLPMLLMAYGDLECDKDFEQVKKCIYREVYNTK